MRNLRPLAARLAGDRRARQLGAAGFHHERVLERIPRSLDVGRSTGGGSLLSIMSSSSLLKKVFEVSLWATLIQDPSARRTKDSQPSGFGFEYCASHVRFRVFQQTARSIFPQRERQAGWRRRQTTREEVPMFGMKRREFITLLGGAAAWPLAARAQQSEQVQRVGVLMGLAEDDPDAKARLAGFRQGLESLGWSEGRNIRLDTRFAPGGAQVQVLAKELVGLQPEVILAHATPLVAALRRETVTIPIVFANITDPVGSGFVASLARPGGNITGLLLFEASITGKWLAQDR